MVVFLVKKNSTSSYIMEGLKTSRNLLPLNIIEIVLDFWFYLTMLKYSVDYFTPIWIDKEQPILSYLDPSFSLKLFTPNIREIFLYFTLSYITLYWMLPLMMFLNDVKRSNLALNANRMIFLITKNVLLLPMLQIVLSLFVINNPYSQSF